MKKKFCLMLLFVLIVPVVAFFGCGTTNYYTFSFLTSGEGSITVNGLSQSTGRGTFASGSRVTLKATASEGEVLGWVFERTTLIVDGEDGYSISQTEENKESVLSFTSSANKEGQYTAVFSSTDKTGEKYVDYVKLAGFMFEKPDQDDESALFTISALDIAQGATSNPTREYEFVFAEGLEIVANQIYNADDYLQVNKVLQLISLQDDSTNHKRVKVSMRIGNSFVNFDDEYIKIGLRNNQETDKVTYSNGTYNVKFSFTYSTQQYNLVLIYKILGNN